MFFNEDNQSEQIARTLINSIRKSVVKGDMKSASRRLSRVKALTADRNVQRTTAGELLLTAASLARSIGKPDQAVDLVMEILHGKGGMSIEILGRAKRLRARLLLDEGKLAEAEVLTGTADRYIVTGLMDEKIETTHGRDVRVRVPVEQKFLDQGEHLSFETYFLLSEIAVLEDNWQKAVWNIHRAMEKHQNAKFFPELEMWRGILAMAAGESLIAFIEPVFEHGNVPAVTIGRIEALLGEDRREDSPLNEAEFSRFQKISEFARKRPLMNPFEANQNEIPSIEEVSTNVDDVKAASKFSGNQQEFDEGPHIITVDLTRLSILTLIELCNMERLTGIIELKWNAPAVDEGVKESILHPAVACGGGLIFCQNGRFIDAELAIVDESLDGFAPDKKVRGEFFLHQVLMTAIGGGCWRQLDNLKINDGGAIETANLPQITGRIIPNQNIREREDVLQITSNTNTCLDVAKMLDEIRGGVNQEDDKEIDWELDWGKPANQPLQTPTIDIEKEKFTDSNVASIGNQALAEMPPPVSITTGAAMPSPHTEKIDLLDFQNNSQNFLPVLNDEPLELQIDETFSVLENGKPPINNDADEQESHQLAAGEKADSEEETILQILESPVKKDFLEIAPPWKTEDTSSNSLEFSDSNNPISRSTVPDLVLHNEEINGIITAQTWFGVNEKLAQILSAKFMCGIRSSIARENEEFIASAVNDDLESIAEFKKDVWRREFSIIEKIKWIIQTDRVLTDEESIFGENLIAVCRLTLMDIDYQDGEEVRSIGGVTIADDQWLEKFMVPPVSLIMRRKINEAEVYASQDGVTLPNAHILLGGETGTGKDVFARLIHEMSGRRNKNFVRADMGAIGGGDQFIATLFGAVKGAYTGQHSERKGLVEEAEGGTLFLNEIGNLSLESQRALLDFMQEGCYTRLGDTKLRNANVRVILATNEDINDSGKFRQDVKFRCAPPVVLPPLRDRREDIASLAVHFAGPEVVIREAAIKLLEFQPWQGNVRELDQVIKTVVAKIGGQGEIKPSVIEEVLANLTEGQTVANLSFPVPPNGMNYSQALEAYENFLLRHSLNITGNKNSSAAKLWGESPASITKKVKKWKIVDED